MDERDVEGPRVLRYAAFSAVPEGGNPAGVVLDAAGMDDAAMLAVAARVGYSETAFVTPPPEGLAAPEGRGFTLRFFSPVAEVPFCGHATVATAAALAARTGPGELVFATPAGTVPVSVAGTEAGGPRVTLGSVAPHTEDIAGADVAPFLDALGWRPQELDASLPPRIAYAGARHLVLAAATRERLARLSYDFDRLRALMLARDLTTLQLVWRDTRDATVFHVRDPFPVGGVVEDPATGAAAAALGGYLRELGLVPDDARLTLHQGVELGRPSELTVELRQGDTRVYVSGAAVPIG
ncbi:PhzF family phenazine biosynthesis isomerase [Streptomyces sp. TRM 70351]|uniref:PhzF family phenazine biosynthesis protein n=1 Tax=Streptomyces sp. TRM 70351 TaxID=3116552 RepID=UPI002E7AFE3B|nr:PhzF family phenazine biosynthesis isomerase [Streptomyces sp. TRM 70351]MEE1928579.1 PhzF family phenazine biosynthesis isomerase [Streptomyces sp. TRM 70351]